MLLGPPLASRFQVLECTAVSLQFLCAGLPSANFSLQGLHLLAQRLKLSLRFGLNLPHPGKPGMGLHCNPGVEVANFIRCRLGLRHQQTAQEQSRYRRKQRKCLHRGIL